VKGLADLASKLSPPGAVKIEPDGSIYAFPQMTLSTHEEMMAVLRRIIDELPEEKPPSEDDVRQVKEAYRSRQSLVPAQFPKTYG
jgi:acylphosphatase